MLYFISQASRNCVRHKNPRIDRLFLFLIYNHSTISKHNDTHCISYQWEVKEQTHTFMQSRIIPLPLVWPLSEGMVDQSPIRFCLLTDEFLAWGTPHLHTNNLWYRKVPLLKHTHRKLITLSLCHCRRAWLMWTSSFSGKTAVLQSRGQDFGSCFAGRSVAFIPCETTAVAVVVVVVVRSSTVTQAQPLLLR